MAVNVLYVISRAANDKLYKLSGRIRRSSQITCRQRDGMVSKKSVKLYEFGWVSYFIFGHPECG